MIKGDDLRRRVALNFIFADKLGAATKINRSFSRTADVFQAGVKDLVKLGLGPEKARAVTSGRILDHADKEIDDARKRGYAILTIEDRRYPSYLREVFDPPFVLYCAGKVEALRDPSVSIVGARRPSPYGRAVAERLAQDLAERGLIVVSGLARGIDSIAHWGALRGGQTVAVLGSGLNVVYPKENKALFKKIMDNGAVISEFPLQSPPLAFHFPQRNRIISGLSLALVVVEATRKSGSLISARLALEQNREVMAVPGNVTSELSLGTNWLIKMGAKLVETWEDVGEELPPPLKEKLLSQKPEKKARSSKMSPEEKEVYDLLKPDTLTHIDELVEGSKYSISELFSILLSLELKELISPRPGKYYQRMY